ncbi:MAG: hypothetical protein AB8G05_17405 [Oligoflexales bacterium]
MLWHKLASINSVLSCIFFLAVGLEIGTLAYAAEKEQKREKQDSSSCFVFPIEQHIKTYDSRSIFHTINSDESITGKYKIFIISNSFPSFLQELFYFDNRLLNAKDQWSFHKFRFGKHLLKAQIQNAIASGKTNYHWELKILNLEQLFTELADSTDLAHAIIFLHGDESGSLYSYDGQKLPLDTFTNFAPSIQSICIASCFLPLALNKYSIRENFLLLAERYFIEAVNDDNEEYRIDSA